MIAALMVTACATTHPSNQHDFPRKAASHYACPRQHKY